MNWFRQNRFMGGFLVALALATLLSLFLLFRTKAGAADQQERLDTTINELTRLRGSAPFPNEENLRQTKAQTDRYRSSLLALESELKNRMFPKPPLQPNEFQALLRQAANSIQERARASKVQLPDNFHLGFDEYATSLPNSLAAPRLGRQLRAIEWIANTLVDAHVDSLSSLTRSPLAEETTAATPTPTPGGRGRAPMAGPKVEQNKIVDSTGVDVAFAGSPAAARRVFNQIGSARDQFYIIRTLQVKNQADKGPKRGDLAEPRAATPVAAVPPAAGAPAKAAEPGITFIVGAEHLDITARIEILRFNFPEKETR